MTLPRSFWPIVVVAALISWARPVAATPPALKMEASPLLGAKAPAGNGWFSYAVNLENVGIHEIRGDIELKSELSWSRERGAVVTRAPFAIAGGSKVLIELPTHGFAGAPPSVSVRALDAEGEVIKQIDVADSRANEPLILDLNVPSRLATVLRGASVPVESFGAPRGLYGTPQLAVSSPHLDPASGEFVLPAHAAAYASATLVVAKSEQLAHISDVELDALGSWVLAGGALAVVVNRPEDLRGPVLGALLGGPAHLANVAPELKAPRTFYVVPDPSAGGGSAPGYPAPGSLDKKHVAPSAEVAQKLVGFAGGSLRASPWGASASYGLGEVHLLAFDVTHEKLAVDEWVELSMLDLVRHAWDRRVTLALPLGQNALDGPQLDAIRRHLDPNESTRWTIAVCALLLLLYAVVAGPLNFYWAARRGKPLRALWHLPIHAATAMALVVLLGMLGKGLSGRARRLTLIESGAGMPRAAATRFRGFFASSADELTVRATERGSVLDVASDATDALRTLVVDRDGARLESFRAKPWQTVLVREDGLASLGAGISLVDAGDGELVIKNRTAHDLVGVVVKPPGKPAVYFSRIADGQGLLTSQGKRLPPVLGASAPAAGPAIAPLDVTAFADAVDRDVERLSNAWAALEAAVDRPVDWWPSDVPVLLAQLEGGEGRTSDSGLRVDFDQTLIRVIGYGGVK